MNTSTQQISPALKETEKIQLKYYEHIGGKDWHETIGRYPDIYIKNNHKFDDFINFINTDCDEFNEEDKQKFISYLQHCKEKFESGRNFYSAFIGRPDKDYINAVMFKEINLLVHLHEPRKLTVREYLTFMGHPQDFEMQGTDKINRAGHTHKYVQHCL